MKLSFVKLILIFLVTGINIFVFRDELVKGLSSWRGQNLVSDVRIGRRWGNFEEWKTRAEEYSGWSQVDRIDLSLDPGSRGVSVYKFSRPPQAKITVLQLALFYPKSGSNRVGVSSDGQDWQTIAENKRYHLVPLDISSIVGDREYFFVKIEAVNNNPAGASVDPITIVYDFNLMFYRHPVVIPRFGLMLIALFLPLILIIRPNLKAILLVLVLALGLHLGLKELTLNRYHSFDSDILCLTKEVPRFISSDLKTKLLSAYCAKKESGVMMTTFGLWPVFGYGSEIAIKLTSLIFQLLLIIFAFVFGKKIKSFTVGLAAALFIAVHPYLISMTSRGLRDSPFNLLILIFIFFLFAADLKKTRNKILLFLAGTAVIYVRYSALIQLMGLAVVMVIYKALNHKFTEGIKQGIFALLAIAVAALPLILNNLKVAHDWDPGGKQVLRWNANEEFAGTPGFPSKEEERKNPYQGPPITFYTYFFELHTFPDLIVSSYRGMKTTFSDLYFNGRRLVLVIFLFGGWLMLKDKKLRYLPFLVFFLEIPHFFFVEKNLIEFRSLTHSLPLIGLVIGYGIDRLWEKRLFFAAPEKPSAIRERLEPRLYDYSYVMTRFSRLMMERFLALLPKGKRKVLDLGCGYKPFRALFPRAKYVGVDLDVNSYADVIADNAKLPFRNSIFDVVIITEVLEHCQDEYRVISELRRVAKPGALVYLTIPFIFPLHGVPQDYNRFTQFKLRALFKKDKILFLQGSNNLFASFFIFLNLVLRILCGSLKIVYPVYVINNLLALAAENLSRFYRDRSGLIGKYWEYALNAFPMGYALIVRISK